MSEPIRVFVNGRGVLVPAGSSVLDAVTAADPAAGAQLRDGTRQVTDSRGLPVSSDAPVSGGYVMRVIPVRSRSAAGNDE